MLFCGKESREEILELISTDEDAFDNIIAMANVGMAFCQICALEDHVGGLILISKTQLSKKLKPNSIDKAELLLEKHKNINNSTLGRLITAIEESGIKGRDIRYLRKIVNIRNNFVHRFNSQVPFTGDWERYGYTLQKFTEYTRYVTKHTNCAQYFFSRIMVKHGLLAGQFGDFGAII